MPLPLPTPVLPGAAPPGPEGELLQPLTPELRGQLITREAQRSAGPAPTVLGASRAIEAAQGTTPAPSLVAPGARPGGAGAAPGPAGMAPASVGAPPRVVTVGTDTYQPIGASGGVRPESAASLAAGYEESVRRYGEAQSRQIEAEADAQAQIREARQRGQERLDYTQSVIDRQQRDMAQRRSETRARVDRDVERISSEPIDSSSWWANKSTGEQILLRVAAALGGIGAGLSGGRNTALDAIQARIDSDLADQRERREKRIASARERGETELAGIADSGAQWEAWRLAQQQRVANAMAELTEKIQDPVRRANAESQLAEWQNRMALQSIDVDKAIHGTVSTRFDPRRTVVVGGVAGAIDEREAELQELELRGKRAAVAKAEQEVAGAGGPGTITTPAGNTYRIDNPRKAGELSEKSGQATNTIRDLEEARVLLRESPLAARAPLSVTESSRRISELEAQISGALKRRVNLKDVHAVEWIENQIRDQKEDIEEMAATAGTRVGQRETPVTAGERKAAAAAQIRGGK